MTGEEHLSARIAKALVSSSTSYNIDCVKRVISEKVTSKELQQL
jgi:hypothetical protein